MLNRFVSVDLETTGLNHGKDKITEIGIVRFIDDAPAGEFKTLVNPGILIPESIEKITDITNEDVKNAPAIGTVIKDAVDFIGNDVIVGHSIMFDYRFLLKAAVNAGLSFEAYGIDTLKISRKVLKDVESKKLEDLCKYFNIPDENHHRALNDAYAAAYLYLKLKEICTEEDLKPYKLMYKVKKEGPITAHQKERLLELLDYYHINPPYDVDMLTKNEASRNIDKIIFEYGRIKK